MNTEDKSVDKTAESRPYTLRPLCDEDLYPMLDIIGRLGRPSNPDGDRLNSFRS